MKFSMIGQEKCDLLYNTVDCLIEVTTLAGLIIFLSYSCFWYTYTDKWKEKICQKRMGYIKKVMIDKVICENIYFLLNPESWCSYTSV